MTRANRGLSQQTSAAPSPRSNRRALRDATRIAHQTAEDRWTRALTGKGDGDGLLRAMQALHCHFGLPAATCAGSQRDVAQEELRLDALRRDLDVPPIDRIEVRTPFEQSPDHAWGVLYALNGSAMGAAMMLRPGGLMAERRPAYMALMRGYAQSGGLGAFFRALDEQELVLPDATEGACDVFATMGDIARSLES